MCVRALKIGHFFWKRNHSQGNQHLYKKAQFDILLSTNFLPPTFLLQLLHNQGLSQVSFWNIEHFHPNLF